MTQSLIISIGFLGLALACIVTSVIAMFKAKYDKDGKITEWDSPLGKIRSASLPFLTLVVGLAFGWFTYQMQPPPSVASIAFDGVIMVDDAIVDDVHSVVVGVTTPPWSQTSTPDPETGEIRVRIAVPENWQHYIGYAFAHGSAPTRPRVLGLRKETPQFELTLEGEDG